MTPRRPTLGSVIEIPLPDGRYAYGRVFRDACLAIYRDVTDAPGHPPLGSREYRFIAGASDNVFTAPKVRIVGQDAFGPDEDEWPPPQAIRDPITGGYRIYHRGEMRPASVAEAAHLEPAAVWSLDHIIQRIMAVTP